MEVAESRAEIVLHRDDESKRVVLRLDGTANSLCRERSGLFSRQLVRTVGYVAATGRDRRPMGDAQMCLLVEKFSVTSYPTHILIDREGCVRSDAVPGLNIDSSAFEKSIDMLFD